LYPAEKLSQKIEKASLRIDSVLLLMLFTAFEAVENGATNSFMQFIHQSLHMLVFFSAVPWLGPLWMWLPVPEQKKKDTRNFYAFAKARFDKRKAKGTDRQDVFSYLLDRDSESGKALRPKEIQAESRIVIIAGA
jgi:cytochrome P450